MVERVYTYRCEFLTALTILGNIWDIGLMDAYPEAIENIISKKPLWPGYRKRWVYHGILDGKWQAIPLT